MSRATTLVSVNQHLAVSAGVAVGAASVESTMWLHHVTELNASLFAPAFVVVSVISTLSTYFWWEMPRDAGHQVSGRGMIVVASPERDAEPEKPPPPRPPMRGISGWADVSATPPDATGLRIGQ